MVVRRVLLVLLVACGGGGEHRGPTDPGPPVLTSSLSGVVTTVGTSSPVAGATVSVGGQSLTTTADGRYAFSGLSVGQATLSVQRSGYEPYSRTITLVSGSNTLNVELSQSTGGTSVTGTIRGTYPLTGQTVVLSGATVTIAGKSDTTDAAGNFQVPTVPEGNQEVLVRLSGWREYRQAHFISSTNRNLTIELAYALPVLRSVRGEWQICGCATGMNRSFVARLAPAAPMESFTTFRVEASYQAYAVLDGRPVTLGDAVRRGGELSCSSGVYCDQVPGITPTPGIVYQGSAGTHGAFSHWLIGKLQPPTTDPGGLHAFVVNVASRPDVGGGCTVLNSAYVGSRATVGFRGTLTVRADPDTNQWTHYDVPFEITTPWNAPTNSTFCNQ
jgi:hypothetical protein